MEKEINKTEIIKSRVFKLNEFVYFFNLNNKKIKIESGYVAKVTIENSLLSGKSVEYYINREKGIYNNSIILDSSLVDSTQKRLLKKIKIDSKLKSEAKNEN